MAGISKERRFVSGVLRARIERKSVRGGFLYICTLGKKKRACESVVGLEDGWHGLDKICGVW